MIESVLPAVNVKSSLPVLSRVLVAHDGPVLTLSGENLDMRITAKAILAEEAKSPWALCAKPQDMLMATQVHGRRGEIFLQAIQSKQGSPKFQLGLEIHPEGKNDPTGLLVEALPEREFPTGRQFEGEQIELHPSIISAIKTVSPCMSQDETRYILNGVCVATQQDAVVACDGRRLACVRLSKHVIPKDFDVILRKEMVGVLLNLPEDRTTSVRYERDESGRVQSIEFTTRMSWGTLTIAGKTLTGTYPNWPNVVPSKTQIGWTPKLNQWNLADLPPSEFLQEWESVTILPPDNTPETKSRGAKLVFKKGDRKYPAAAAEMHTDAIAPLKGGGSSEPGGVSVNPRFIDDMRKVFLNRREPSSSPNPTILDWGGLHPLMAEAHLGSTFYVVMPMRYQE
jgi:hypothetical protein